MIRAHLNRTSPQRFRQSSAPSASRLLLASMVLAIAGGCRTPHLYELAGDGIEVRLDSNSKAHMPGRKIKFFVDLVNHTGSDVDISQVEIELRASPRGSPETVNLRQTWTYRWPPDSPPLRPGKRMTVPIVPEQGGEFPLAMLSAGDYEIVAVVNELFTSGPYPLAIVRPDLETAGSDSTIPSTHRRFEGESPLVRRGFEQTPSAQPGTKEGESR